jgi:A/G-specific adenine glycosylase
VVDFAQKMIRWQRRHGRHGLPWQRTRDPYRIWLSEIMLQQTTVAAVGPYYHRFLERFPERQRFAWRRGWRISWRVKWDGIASGSRGKSRHSVKWRKVTC